MGAPSIGAATYTHQPWKATVFQPARKATILGPKSLAGFKPAWVSGARNAMRAPTVAPIIGGANPPFIASFFSFVKAKMTKARTPVPMNSARNAVAVETGDLRRRWRER